MTESAEQKKVLEMLAEGKITIEEAENLLDKLRSSAENRAEDGEESRSRTKPKFLRISCHEEDGDDVDIRIPLGFLKGGVKLAAMLPESVRKQLEGKAFAGIGVAALEGDELLQALENLEDLELDVDSKGASVRICCE
jgi:hypothetical protein